MPLGLTGGIQLITAERGEARAARMLAGAPGTVGQDKMLLFRKLNFILGQHMVVIVKEGFHAMKISAANNQQTNFGNHLCDLTAVAI